MIILDHPPKILRKVPILGDEEESFIFESMKNNILETHIHKYDVACNRFHPDVKYAFDFFCLLAV